MGTNFRSAAGQLGAHAKYSSIKQKLLALFRTAARKNTAPTCTWYALGCMTAHVSRCVSHPLRVKRPERAVRFSQGSPEESKSSALRERL